VSIERIFHCDGPGCERHVQTVEPRPRAGFVFISDGDDEFHFCGWDCVLRYASAFEPEVVIPFSNDDAGGVSDA
jgi:hypothetical protein